MGKDEVTKEELDALNKEIDQTQQMLTETKVKEAREAGRKEAEKELDLKRQLDEAAKKTKELEDQLNATKKESQDKLVQLQTKVDEMVSSKAIITPPASLKNRVDEIDTWSNDKIQKIEEASGREFFGENSYEEMLRGR